MYDRDRETSSTAAGSLGKVRLLWERLQGTLWFLPGVITAFAVLLSLGTILVDDWLITTGRASKMWFVFGVGAEGVRGVLSSIAGGIITVTGVVFSITIVALQLASTQFTPRMLRTFISDRANQVVLGVFIGTFTYALLILRFVRGDGDDLSAFVPSISVTVAMIMALVSVGFLIFFINHIAQSITASAVIDRLTREGVATAMQAFPRRIGEPASGVTTDDQIPSHEAIRVETKRRGYLQLVREEDLLDLAAFGPLVLRMEGEVGEFFNTGDVVASVWATDQLMDRGNYVEQVESLRDKVRDAFVLGTAPTGFQDVALGITRLVDVAVKALSPGINDPGTAMMCIDGLSELLIVVGEREPPDRVREAKGGLVRLIARRPSFEDLVALAFGQIRYYGANDPAVAIKLLETIEHVATRLPAVRHGALARQASLIAEAAEARLHDGEHVERLRHVARRVLPSLVTPPTVEATSTGARRVAP